MYLDAAAAKRFLGEYERWMLHEPAGAGRVGFRGALRDAVHGYAEALTRISHTLSAARVRHTIEEHTDKVHVVALCESCGERVMTLGTATQASDPEFLIV
jgi:hypothetical protein